MDLKIFGATENLWDPSRAEDLSPLEELAYRSNLLGSDRSVANYGGGNTSVKVRQEDHTGREVDVLWVKGSGSDLATIKPGQFTGLRLAEILPLAERDSMSDEEMVSYLARCQLAPEMPRSSIETLLHAFIPHPHVDHTHPDAVNMLCCAANGEELARECFGEEALWIPYMRPGFALSKKVAEAVRKSPRARFVLLAKHGLVTWGATGEESYARTIEAINRAAEFVFRRSSGGEPFGGRRLDPQPEERRRELLAEVLPALRGELSSRGGPKILRVDTSQGVTDFVCGRGSAELSQVGAACPDHLVNTKVRPLWVDFDPSREGPAELEGRLREGVRRYQEEYEEYFRRNRARVGRGDERMHDPNPRVILISGVGLVAAGKDLKSASLSRDLYHRAIAVIRGASSVDRFVSLSEEESYAVEYWPLELYKLTLAPPPKELAGRVALVTGGAGGIGGAVARRLHEAGACVVVADLDGEGAGEVASSLGPEGLAVRADVTSEAEVARAFHAATLAYGGVDIVVSNAGLASSAPVEKTSLELWRRNHAVLSEGYFLVAREAFRVLGRQGTGGSLVFVGSKNALAAGKNAAAYSSAKAAELHLARCLAEEGGPRGIRVNTVNPDAVLQGSRIWDSSWREERARAYGIPPDELEEYYRKRTTLKVSVYPEDVAEAVLHFASERRSGKSTGNVLNVDGGVREAYPR
ncbi:3-phenylpropionate-dihydrodiol/cinnamic acid-dihydrodiol dehydrogenase [Rubrobacter xylanophilus DSM 9941]|uniref:bifunctional aldolase/short-chain dehydrogenase n=1 Tax=Rubrobacter xylanophilus TaxID=49319 RepID=UPI001C63F306|nr:bifunctional aldolase/short-chain dehydrogenase [Rubrobacter xylanophilus]QYJ14948.1 3-phenylpropionate-dihydrodiol/cinnamic acid-dihydrodiol dehydrogenase [Rubrobacter xylanophilus DSM 9941]